MDTETWDVFFLAKTKTLLYQKQLLNAIWDCIHFKKNDEKNYLILNTRTVKDN